MTFTLFNVISSYLLYKEKLWPCDHWSICLTLQTSLQTWLKRPTNVFKINAYRNAQAIILKKSNDSKSTKHISDGFQAFYRYEINEA